MFLIFRPGSTLNLFVCEPGMKSIVLFNFSTKNSFIYYLLYFCFVLASIFFLINEGSCYDSKFIANCVNLIILSKSFRILVAPKFFRFQLRERLLDRQTILFHTPVCDSKPGKTAMFLRE